MQTHPLPQPNILLVDTGAAALPIAAWLSDISPYLTVIATLLSISWFIRLWYLSLKKKDTDLE